MVVVAVAAIIGVLAWPSRAASEDRQPTGPGVELVLFWLDGCPHCEAEREFLADLQADYPGLVISAYELSSDAAGRELFGTAAARLGFEPEAVPTTVIGDRYWIGWTDAVGREIEAEVAARLGVPLVGTAGGTESEATPPGGAAVDHEEGSAGVSADGPAGESTVDVPVLGEVELAGRSLVVTTLVIGFVDGINPCSLWVLSVVLALVLHSRSRRRVLAVGATFLAVTTAMYGLYIIGVYTLLSYVAYLSWIQRLVAVVAALAGLLTLKDGLGIEAGPSLAVAEQHKPGIYRRIRALGASDRPLLAVLGATAALAVGVSLLETPCSAAYPVLWTDLLTAADTGLVTSAALFGLYMAVFLADELLVFGVVVATMRAARLQERHGRLLQILSGVVMLVLAGAMVIDPDLLTTAGGALLLTAIAVVLTAAIVAVAHHRDRRRMAPPKHPALRA